jgi:hypothetical protein
MNITDPRFKYVPSHLTDIRKTFAKHGWKPKEQVNRVRADSPTQPKPTGNQHENR